MGTPSAGSFPGHPGSSAQIPFLPPFPTLRHRLPIWLGPVMHAALLRIRRRKIMLWSHHETSKIQSCSWGVQSFRIVTSFFWLLGDYTVATLWVLGDHIKNTLRTIDDKMYHNNKGTVSFKKLLSPCWFKMSNKWIFLAHFLILQSPFVHIS